MEKTILGNLATLLMMLLLGAIFMLPSGYKLYDYAVFCRQSVMVDGVVDKPVGGGSGFGGRPLVQYQDPAGTVHVIKSRVKTHLITAPQKGETVRVRFLASDPRTAIVDSRFHNIFLPSVFFILGSAVVLYALKGIVATII